MKKLVLVLAATVAASPALAADVMYNEPMAPMAPMAIESVSSGWTGLYVGVQAGGAFNPDSEDLALQTNGFGPGALGAAFGSNFDSSFESSFLGGAHVGYDHQIGGLVFGVLTDLNAIDVAKTASAYSSTPAFYRTERSLDYVGTVRARAGALVNENALAYVTGGLAYGSVDYSFSTNSPAVTAANPAVVSSDEDDFGYAVGAGMEVKVTDNINFGAEYLYTNLGGGDSVTVLTGGPFNGGVPGGSTTFRDDSDFDFHTVTAKISYRFN